MITVFILSYLFLLVPLHCQDFNDDRKNEFKILPQVLDKLSALENLVEEEQVKIVSITKQLVKKDSENQLLNDRITLLEKITTKLV